LGCSGGRQVRDVIMKGYLGIGIEGSDYSKSRLRAEWATIPEFLFTADITKRFTIKDGGGGCLRFGAVTLWEVMEHIRKSDLPPLMDNIDRHLAPGGIVIASISVAEEVIKGVALHQTVAHKEWWISELSRLGWTQHDDLVCYFGKDVVRGGENAPSSFHVVLSRTAEPLLGLKPNQPY